MVDLTKYILQALYEATGHSGQAVDIVATLRGRWPQLKADDVRTHLGDLSARALLTVRADGYGAITGAGIRNLSKLWTDGAFGPVPPSAAPHVERLHALAAAQADSDAEANATQPYSITQQVRVAEERSRSRASAAPQPATAAMTPVETQIDYMRRAVEVVIQEISAATDLPMEEWSHALEATAQVDGALDSLTSILRR